MKDKYFVDKRSGCIAVCDRDLIDPDYSLHSDTKGVVKFWMGHRHKEKCPTCGYERAYGWVLDPNDVCEAITLCETLNIEWNKSYIGEGI